VGTGNSLDYPNRTLILWSDTNKERVGNVEFLKPIIDLKVLGGWVLVI